MSVKKILALLLAAMMVFGMTSAMAANSPEVNNPAATTMSIPLTKTLYFYNVDAGTVVYEPAMTYEYEIYPANIADPDTTATDPSSAPAITTTDNDGNTVAVKPGDMRGFGTTNAGDHLTRHIYYSPEHATVEVTENGKAVSKQITISFDGTKLTKDGDIRPGVYRYVIEEKTAQDDKNAKGIIDNTTTKKLILDVFVTNEGNVTGAAIHDPTPANGTSNPGDPVTEYLENSSTNNETLGNDNGKTTGFGDAPTTVTWTEEKDTDGDGTEDTSEGTDAIDEKGQKTGQTELTSTTVATTADNYTTYNMKVTKTVEGTMGDKSNYFPFKVTFANTVADAYYTVALTDGSTTNNLVQSSAQMNNDTTSAPYYKMPSNYTLGADAKTASENIQLKDGQTLTITGVPEIVVGNALTGANLTAKVNEFNNTRDSYLVQEDYKVGSTVTPMIGTTGTADTNYVTLAGETSSSTLDDTAKEIDTASTASFDFRNKLNEISPTGVVLRFAPYFAMFAAGCVLFLILATKRSKKEEE